MILIIYTANLNICVGPKKDQTRIQLYVSQSRLDRCFVQHQLKRISQDPSITLLFSGKLSLVAHVYGSTVSTFSSGIRPSESVTVASASKGFDGVDGILR